MTLDPRENAPMSCDELPLFDLTGFMSAPDSPESVATCKALSQCLVETGCLVVRDPRVDMNDNSRFLDMMENYFARSYESKMAEARPELAYQVCVQPTRDSELLSRSLSITVEGLRWVHPGPGGESTRV
eukprot:1133565-Pyramimonas_sp.AAC.1